MDSIFLSASVPVNGRGDYYETADPFLIQCAVREFAIAVVRKMKIVWGGHPAITPCSGVFAKIWASITLAPLYCTRADFSKVGIPKKMSDSTMSFTLTQYLMI